MIKIKPRNEDGWVLITATVLLSVMLVMGLAAMTLVNSDSHRTREQRETESALNVDEGVLYAQTMVLGQNWPSANNHPNVVSYCDSATATPPASAGAATGASLSCPNPTNLAGSGTSASFNNVDTQVQTTWRTKVRDNGGPLASSYDPLHANDAQTGCASVPCNYDANGDGQLWVQAQTITRGHPRNVVARMKLEKVSENIPRTAVTAGALSVTNNGNHGGTPIIDATGSQVLVRCQSNNTGCVNANSGQVTPTPTVATSSTVPPNLMTAEQLARFKQRAVTDGHYFAGCPNANSDLSGAVVWVEGCASPPNFANQVPTTTCTPPLTGMSSSCVNTNTAPGMLIWHCGRANFQGNFTYHGLLYMVNDSDGTCPATLPQQVGDYTCSNQPSVDTDHDVLNTNGGFAVWGAVAVDGGACLKVGSNNLQIKFDPKVFDAVESYGTVGLVQNTWRELQPNVFAGS
jgi:Tfp pilus assembly protein PilX